MTDEGPNREQRAYWNERAGLKWVALQEQLDAQLEPCSVAVMDKLRLQASGLRAGMRVLDVGCGAGATSLALAARVAPGEVVGIDISAPLLDCARARGAGVFNLRFEQADAQTFSFDGPQFDVVFSRFGVMFFSDSVEAFSNLRSVLCADGRLAFVCWRAPDENPWATLPLAAAHPFLPKPPEPPEPPTPGAPGPFAFADGARTRSILERAGFVDIDVAPHDGQLLMAGGGFEAAVDLALQIGPLGRELNGVDADVRAKARSAVREAMAPHQGPSGVTLAAATWLVTARRG